VKPWYHIVSRKDPQGGWMVLRLFSDGADAYRFAERIVPPGSVQISLITDASGDVDGNPRPHEHYWAVQSWYWENYRWENREPAADTVPVKDACPCGEERPHLGGTPWPPHAGVPIPDYGVVRFEAGPRPRASRGKAVSR
jgi:hypothetical protein